MKNTILISCALMAVAAFGGPGRVFPQVRPADEPRLARLVAEWPAVPAAKPRKILVCNYLRGCEWHGPSVTYGTRVFALASVKGGYAADFTDIRQLAIKGLLDGYDAVVLNNTTNFQEAEAPGVSENLLAYVSKGGGLLLVHSAVDAFNDSPAVQEMNGGLFWAHPWTRGGTWCFRNEEPGHPLVASFRSLPGIYRMSDEIYMHPTPPFDRTKVRVLISLCLDDAETSAAMNKFIAKHGEAKVRADRDFAVSWCRRWGKGRVFYTTYAHDERAWLDPARLYHILGGLQYAIGDVKADDTPRADGK
ncbi:MAG: ThuA domain-containing protein [Kiritimatiellae bacterium]|nr:ThuA domain-containing protein [Kiritimatiellia bacterium]